MKSKNRCDIRWKLDFESNEKNVEYISKFQNRGTMLKIDISFNVIKSMSKIVEKLKKFKIF